LGRPRVLILGGGFGGVYAALEFERVLRRQIEIDVTLVTRDNFLLFTPMLPEIAASELEISSIVNPLRKLLKRVNVFVGEIRQIDLESRRVLLCHGDDQHLHELNYDHVVIALGCATNFFGLPGVEEQGLTFKTLEDAVSLRSHLIALIEEAGSECSIGKEGPMLTFVIAGAGFAGVETVGAINDFVREALPFYPRLRPDRVRTVLITPDELILPELGPKLGRYAQRKLAMRGIEIITHARVKAVRDGKVELTNGAFISTGTLVWTAGTAAHSMIARLPLPTTSGRIKVDETLEVPGWPGVWAVGDCAAITDVRAGGFSPPTAQHAIREGRTAARNIIATLRHRARRKFSYRSQGKLAAIGRRSGVADIFGVKFSGFVAWWLWRTVYLIKLPRLEKKVRVAFDWTIDLFFAKDFACLNASFTRLGRITTPVLVAGLTSSSDSTISNREKSGVKD
jgi:NADH dehydrogenase